MDLLNRIKQLEKNIEKIDILAKKLAQDNSNKQKRINLLEEKIQNNIRKIDEIIEGYNAKN
jgi:hypothetical protein|tara:strand:- start:235 stop:417 length:183 start_codon:yes stop_codon:yes gene_type:complete